MRPPRDPSSSSASSAWASGTTDFRQPRNAGQNVGAQSFGPCSVANGTGMDAIHGHAHRRRRFWMPVHDATALIRQHAGQGLVHLVGPTAHEPSQRLWQRQAGMHGRHGAVNQQCRLESVVDQLGQTVLPSRPPKRAEQCCRIVSAYRQHHHIEARGRGVIQQLEQTCRVQSVDRQHAPVHRVMLAQATHQLTAQSLLLGRGTHACGTRVAGHQQTQLWATTRGTGAAARRFRHARCDAPHIRCLHPEHGPQSAHQQQTLPR